MCRRQEEQAVPPWTTKWAAPAMLELTAAAAAATAKAKATESFERSRRRGDVCDGGQDDQGPAQDDRDDRRRQRRERRRTFPRRW